MNKQFIEEIARKTLDLNFEVSLFNDQLKSHLNIRTVDLQLLSQLQKTTELLSILMSDCILVDVDTVNIGKNYDMLQLHRQVYCRVCNTAIKTEAVRVQEHLSSEPHQQALKKTTKKEQKKNKHLINATQFLTNSNLTKGTDNTTIKIDSTILVPTIQQKNAEPQPKLSKKVQTFIRDRNLEKLGRTLAEESEKIKMSSKHYVVVESIQKALVSKYPNVKVYPFGSRISGLGSASSDLDLFIDLGKNYSAIRILNSLLYSNFIFSLASHPY